MEQLVVPKAREIDEEELAWPLTESYDEDTNDDAENEESDAAYTQGIAQSLETCSCVKSSLDTQIYYAVRAEHHKAKTSYDQEDEDTNAVVNASTKIESIPRELVEDRGDGWYKWRGYWRWAPSMEEGHLLLNAAWHETQNMAAVARKQDARRQKQLQKLEATDDKFSRLRPVVLKRGTPDALTGRYIEDNNKVTFVEDGTNHRVTLSMPSDTQRRRGGWFKSFLDTQIYNAVKAEHNKAKISAKKKVREKEREQRMPTKPSDMAFRKNEKDGMWIYTFETTEVEVTPRALRPPLQKDATKWKQERHREPTRDRALRKMKKGSREDARKPYRATIPPTIPPWHRLPRTERMHRQG